MVDNHEFTRMMDTSDEWIRSHTGIQTRYIADGESAWELGLGAAEDAMRGSSIRPQEVGMVICSTSSPDYFTPSTASIIAGKLGVKDAICFDLNAACSGGLFGMDVASLYIGSGRVKYALLVAAEKVSKFLDYTDRSTCVLFGDGAGAVVFGPSERGGIISTYLAGDNTGYDMLVAPVNAPPTPFETKKPPALIENENAYLRMAGKGVYKFAVRAGAEAIDEVLKKAGRKVDDVRWFVPHQANLRIIDSISERYGLNKDRVFVSIDKNANTSSSSILIAIDQLNKNGQLRDGDLLLMLVFGAGLTYGAMLYEWRECNDQDQVM